MNLAALESVVADLLKDAADLFPEIFGKLDADDLNLIKRVGIRMAARFGQCISFDKGQRLEAMEGLARNWNAVEFRIISKVASEEKHNAERVMKLIGKGIVAVGAAIPTAAAMLMMSGDAE